MATLWKMLRLHRMIGRRSEDLNHTAMVSLQREKHSPNFGRSHVHWLTGTASTVMVGCVEGILGMRPDFYGLRIAPSSTERMGWI